MAEAAVPEKRGPSLHLALSYLRGTHRITREQHPSAAMRGAHLGVQPVTPRCDLRPSRAAASHRNWAATTPPQNLHRKKAL